MNPFMCTTELKNLEMSIYFPLRTSAVYIKNKYGDTHSTHSRVDSLFQIRNISYRIFFFYFQYAVFIIFSVGV